MNENIQQTAAAKICSPYTREVFYYETDRMGIVHHSNYIRWLEEARNHFYAELGYSFAEIENNGIMVPVVSASCQYKTPFRFGDSFRIQLTPTFLNGVKFSFSYEIYDASTSECKAVGTSEHCFSNFDLKPIRLNREKPEIYEAFVPYFPQKSKN